MQTMASARVALSAEPDPGLPPALAGGSGAIRGVRAALASAGAGGLLILAEEGLDAAGAAHFAHDVRGGSGPFVRVDCAQPDAAALERALFGTRSRTRRADLDTLGITAALVVARRGTLFLEHVGDLPAHLQRRLARVLRDGEARLAGRDRVAVTAHVIASAAPAIAADARSGRFRPDLLRRFTRHVTIPPLRTRPEDFTSIVQRIAAEIAASERRVAPGFTQPALTALSALPWRGNVAELRTVLLRIIGGLTGSIVRQEDVLPTLPVERIVGRGAAMLTLRDARRQFEREYIAAVLEQHEWRMSDAANTLGIERANLYRKTRQLGISRAKKDPSR
jgi:two-component system nitrogen regulation response regulator NtrX